MGTHSNRYETQFTIDQIKSVDYSNQTIKIERSVWLDAQDRHVTEAVVLDSQQAATVVEILTEWLSRHEEEPTEVECPTCHEVECDVLDDSCSVKEYE